MRMFYDVETGAFMSRKWSGPDQELAANTPDGFRSVVGEFDHVTQCVDVKALAAVGDAADPSQFVVERSDAVERRQRRQDELDQRHARVEIGDIELAGFRALREALLELLPADSPSRVRLERDNEAIAALRERIQSTRTEGNG